ncbi:MAG TPA: hypothetical protein VIO33_00805, partial [Burkholderiaceae bacterium]
MLAAAIDVLAAAPGAAGVPRGIASRLMNCHSTTAATTTAAPNPATCQPFLAGAAGAGAGDTVAGAVTVAAAAGLTG